MCRLVIACGEIQTARQFKPGNAERFQLMFLKISALNFGVPIWGTKMLISFRDLITISSLIISLFLFLIGLKL
jgi:hypothetical protein